MKELIILWILLGVLAFLILVVGAWLCSMRRNMPWQNCLAVLGNLKISLPRFLRDYALTGARDYSTLPDPLVMADGTPAATPERFEARRKEILSLFERYVYGPLPREGFDTSFEVVEQGDALGGSALRRQVRITVTTGKGSSDAMMLLYIPKQERPAPVVMGLNFRGNPTVLEDGAILPSCGASGGKREEKRGSCASRWSIADCVSRGYAVATACSADFAPDRKEDYRSRVIGLFDEPEFKAVGAWAFGISRMADYLMTDPAIDGSRMAVVGHSRLGKAALWAGAGDARLGLVISNDSGNTGASLSRGNHGETVYSINKAFPHWFCSGYARYGKNENALPVDQNLLLAAIAPRRLYVASAEDDLWADPQGAFNSLKSAKAAFALYHDSVLPDEMETYPPVGEVFHCESMGVHIRRGGHDITPEDWKHYLDYMDRYVGREGTP